MFSSLLNDVINIIRMRLIDSSVLFAVSVDSNIPNAMVGDEVRIRQVLVNLLSNAVKYTERGYVSFSAHGEVTGDTVNLRMTVTDSGRGIKAEELDHVFDEYMRADSEVKSRA
jgi:signal transduction histidine kinase